eukprot:snap_masked-scaffold_46-processed-gene-1.2-mRNA-1 protein AED:1.00 eAED:1.00 QI:0/0/0/0/1/1/2/0/117
MIKNPNSESFRRFLHPEHNCSAEKMVIIRTTNLGYKKKLEENLLGAMECIKKVCDISKLTDSLEMKLQKAGNELRMTESLGKFLCCILRMCLEHFITHLKAKLKSTKKLYSIVRLSC